MTIGRPAVRQQHDMLAQVAFRTPWLFHQVLFVEVTVYKRYLQVSNYADYNVWDETFIKSQTSTAQPLKFRYR